MTKQEEIRDRLWNILPCPQNPEECPLENCDTCESRTNQVNSVLQNLSSLGVVVKKKRELPENPYPLDYKELPLEFQEEATGEDVYLMAHNGFEEGMRYMLKADFEAVESL